MPFPSNHFDVVLIYDSLHHRQDQRESIQEVYRVVKPKRILAICEIHPQHGLGYFITKIEQILIMKSKFYSPKQMKSMLKGAGLIIKNVGWSKEPTYYIIARK